MDGGNARFITFDPLQSESQTTKSLNGFVIAIILTMAGAYFLYYRYTDKKKRIEHEEAELLIQNKTIIDKMVEEKNKRKKEIIKTTGKLPPPSIMFNVHDLKPRFDASKLEAANNEYVETSYHHRLLPGF